MQTRVQGLSEDWLSVWIGLGIFVLALAVIGGTDLLGWVVSTQVWTDLSGALGTATKAYVGLGGIRALIITYLALLVLLSAGAAAMKANVARFVAGWPDACWFTSVRWTGRRLAPCSTN